MYIDSFKIQHVFYIWQQIWRHKSRSVHTPKQKQVPQQHYFARAPSLLTGFKEIQTSQSIFPLYQNKNRPFPSNGTVHWGGLLAHEFVFRNFEFYNLENIIEVIVWKHKCPTEITFIHLFFVKIFSMCFFKSIVNNFYW